MSDPKNQQTPEQQNLDLEDLNIAESEIEVISNEDARAIPEGNASISEYFCCTLCSSSSL